MLVFELRTVLVRSRNDEEDEDTKWSPSRKSGASAADG
jgi:hypothetical protein